MAYACVLSNRIGNRVKGIMGHSRTHWPKNRHLTEASNIGGGPKEPPLGFSLLDLRAKAIALCGWDREKEILKSVIQGHFSGPAPSGNVDCEAVKGRAGDTQLKEVAEYWE